MGLPVHPRVDAVFGFEYSRSDATSEYRDFVDQGDLPILQNTRLTQAPLTASLRIYLTAQGRDISRFAFIPAGITPYLGAGGGYLWYEFEQQGDFVDFEDLAVFSDLFVSRGWTPTAHVYGGADFKIAQQVYLSTELRYAWTKATLDRDFVTFEPLDLSGLRAAFGVRYLF